MAKSTNDFFIKIEKEIMRWDYFIEDRKTYDSIQRLINSTLAKMAWIELSKKNIKKQSNQAHDIFHLANRIGRWSVSAYLEDSQKLTSQEIRAVSKKAIKLVTELRSLILENRTLRLYGEDLMPDLERAAYSKLLGGLINQACLIDHNDKEQEGRIFSAEIEARINESFETNHPDFKEMTSMDAYKVLRERQIFDYSFLESLKLFGEQIKEFTPSPILPRPKKELADENVYAIIICGYVEDYCGSPCFEISASLCSAFFDHDIEADTIKKWWHRRGDTSDEIES